MLKESSTLMCVVVSSYLILPAQLQLLVLPEHILDGMLAASI